MTNAMEPDFPKSASRIKRRIIVEVEVTIRKDGLPGEVHVSRSSGRQDIDEAAVMAAAGSTYWPKHVACRPFESHYLFKTVLEPHRKSS